MSKDLINDSKVQSVIIKLDKDKPRELKFRQYLDSKRREGMNMKEPILQLFEMHVGSDFVPYKGYLDNNKDKKEEVEIKTTDQKEEVDVSDFDII